MNLCKKKIKEILGNIDNFMSFIAKTSFWLTFGIKFEFRSHSRSVLSSRQRMLFHHFIVGKSHCLHFQFWLKDGILFLIAPFNQLYTFCYFNDGDLSIMNSIFVILFFCFFWSSNMTGTRWKTMAAVSSVEHLTTSFKVSYAAVLNWESPASSLLNKNPVFYLIFKSLLC